MSKALPCCFRLETTRGPHTGSTHYCCSVSHLSSSPDRPLSIGRKKCCWLRLPKDLEVSSVHAEFRFVKAEENETRLGLCDVKSTNGTKINGKMLKTQQDYPLRDGDLIAVGRTSLRFVQVGHGQPCREEGADSAATSTGNAILTPDTTSSSSVIQSAAAPIVIELDNEEETVAPVLSSPMAPAFAGTSGAVSTVIEPSDTSAEPDIEPDHGRLRSVKNVVVIERDMSNSIKEGGDNVELKATAKSGGNNAGVVDEGTPEEATCTTCSTVIGQLDMLEQQAHLNECIGGRVTIATANVTVPFGASTVLNDTKRKARKRGNGGSGATRTKKPRKPKACDNDDSAAAAPKTKRPRKRTRVDTGGDIVLALALTDTSKMDKEQQTDLQLAGTKRKIDELDEQMAKLAKRRANLEKTLSRLEKTKEKYRKSQVLPPAKVLQLLDLKAALNVIFPNNRQVYPWDQRVYTKRTGRSSVVATRYTPLRWSESSQNVDCDEPKYAELAAVAAISMWNRASQQLFGLQRDSLLYRNSVLRTFLGGDEDAECGSIDMDSSVDMENGLNVDSEDADANFEREVEYEEKSELAPVFSDYTLIWTRTCSEVPDVVKRVFPNWQRDLAFLRDQPAEEISMALEAMNGAQAEADAMVISNNEQHEREGCRARISPGHITKGSETLSGREEQRLACKFMAQVMKQLIAEKRLHPYNDEAMQQQQTGMNLVGSGADDCQQPRQQSVIDVSENEVEEELYNGSREELPKALTANGDAIVQCDASLSHSDK